MFLVYLKIFYVALDFFQIFLPYAIYFRLKISFSWIFFDGLFFSPSVLYISQSLLHSDLSMFYRLAHEVCHTWFGIVIGPLDWTEEWLTEGFCTYLEDIIHTRVLKVKKKFCAFISICWILLGWTTKRSDLELQCLIANCINKIICNEFMSNLFLTESPLHLYQYFYDTNMYSTK